MLHHLSDERRPATRGDAVVAVAAIISPIPMRRHAAPLRKPAHTE
jgi:hypothetical protein